jgi:S1-C subfamily serine protease
MRASHLCAPLFAVTLVGGVVFADKPGRPKPATAEYTDDADTLDRFTRKLGELAKADKCMKPADLKEVAGENKTAKLTPAEPWDKSLSPEEVAERVRPSVFLLGSVVGDKKNGYEEGRMATAWAAGADGTLVTNWHVFDGIEDDEHYGAMDHKGEVFPLTAVLAVDKAADVAVVKVAAKGLTPLPLATAAAKVGSWVGVLGHPGDRYYTFTQGAVTRYSVYQEDDGAKTRWMGVTAEYAYGSSGSPVVDRCGNVVAMAALTENIDYPDAGGAQPAARRATMVRRVVRKPSADDKKKGEKANPAAPPAVPSAVQMVLKLTVPASDLRAVTQGIEKE